MLHRLLTWAHDWAQDQFAIWQELGRLEAEAKAKAKPEPMAMAQITYYGKHGEMGHPADRAYPDDGEW